MRYYTEQERISGDVDRRKTYNNTAQPEGAEPPRSSVRLSGPRKNAVIAHFARYLFHRVRSIPNLSLQLECTEPALTAVSVNGANGGANGSNGNGTTSNGRDTTSNGNGNGGLLAKVKPYVAPSEAMAAKWAQYGERTQRFLLNGSYGEYFGRLHPLKERVYQQFQAAGMTIPRFYCHCAGQFTVDEGEVGVGHYQCTKELQKSLFGQALTHEGEEIRMVCGHNGGCNFRSYV